MTQCFAIQNEHNAEKEHETWTFTDQFSKALTMGTGLKVALFLCGFVPVVTSFTEVYSTKASAELQSTTFKMVDSGCPPGSRLKNRLVEAGAPPSEIQIRGDIDCGNNADKEVNGDESTVEVKTLVWEVSCNHQREGISTAEEKVEKFHIVSAKKISDKVDLSLLRDLVYKHQDLPFGCTPSTLSMAPTEIAENLTGFESGCMPPIGHNVPMKLYLEESISEYSIASIGSGTVDHSLLLPMSDLKKIAEANGQELVVGRFIRTISHSPSSVLERDEKEGECKQSTNGRADRRPEPKNRLQEYRSLPGILEKAKLLRTTARKKGRVDMMVELVEEAVRTGDFPHLLQVSEDDGLDKNALHLSAWRGDFDVVKLLVETAQKHCPALDVVNMISRGPGNYGKTPIFYALTQCREDVVRYLVSQGAMLLFVNNKGQTACSIAVSHMEQECCEFLYETELQQLKSGDKFMNFRSSHSDEKLYGDLDPRFAIDAFNMGYDLAAQLEEYTLSTKDNEILHGDYPVDFSPRSLRPTVRWWKRDDRSLTHANDGDSSGQLTFTQPRITGCTRRPKKEQQRSRRPNPSLERILSARELESYAILTIDHVLSSNGSVNMDGPSNVVNCTESIKILESAVETMLEDAKDAEKRDELTADEMLLDCTWGLDCEWLPGEGRGKHNPVSTLQLSTQKRSFLIDLQCLCQTAHLERSENLAGPTSVEMFLNAVLTKLFSSTDLTIVGFGILQDLGQLAGSFPHLSCFTFYASVLDLQSLSNIAVSKAERQDMSSLKRMVGVLLQRKLDKTQQCSNWTRRPLSKEQLDYATLDAAVLPLLLKNLMEKTTIQRYNGQFFETHISLRSQILFTFLPENQSSDLAFASGEKVAWFVPMGRTTTIFGRSVARQSWPTSQLKPDCPKLVPVKTGCTKKERVHLRKVGPNGEKAKAKPIQLKCLLANLDNLPLAGTTLGYTKDSCAHRVIGHEFMNTLPEGTHIGFNRRSGVVETVNTWIIFCNFGGSQNHHAGKQTGSSFLRGGRELLFTLNPKNFHGESSEKTLYEFIVSQDFTTPGVKKILLFARDGTRYKYTYCGFCECDKFFMRDDGKVDLLLKLMDFDELMRGRRISTDFLELVEKQHAAEASIIRA